MHKSPLNEQYMLSTGAPGNARLSRQSQRNVDRVLQLEQAMFESRSRYLILVLTLNYQEHYRHLISLETIQQHRDMLLNNRRSNQLLSKIEGYAWKIEEGQNSGGLHLHIVVFYSGQHRADIQIAQSIGEYWVNVVTRGIGAYWNSNALKGLHAQYGHGIGTGQIDRNDHAKREALRANLAYLAKDDQYVTSKASPHERMFGTSQFPSHY